MAAVNKLPGGGLQAEFAGQVAAWAGKTKNLMGEAYRRTTLRVFGNIITGTPVDTGEAVGGWVVSLGAPKYSLTHTKGIGSALARLNSLNGDFSKPAFLSNSVPHITGLEYGTHSYGFSPKAPAGMVRINVMQFQRILAEEVARIKK